jgi:hypothetical protein
LIREEKEKLNEARRQMKKEIEANKQKLLEKLDKMRSGKVFKKDTYK